MLLDFFFCALDGAIVENEFKFGMLIAVKEEDVVSLSPWLGFIDVDFHASSASSFLLALVAY